MPSRGCPGDAIRRLTLERNLKSMLDRRREALSLRSGAASLRLWRAPTNSMGDRLWCSCCRTIDHRNRGSQRGPRHRGSRYRRRRRRLTGIKKSHSTTGRDPSLAAVSTAPTAKKCLRHPRAEYLRSATSSDLLVAALPGAAGIAGFTQIGAFAGYRQASAVQAALLAPVPTRVLL